MEPTPRVTSATLPKNAVPYKKTDFWAEIRIFGAKKRPHLEKNGFSARFPHIGSLGYLVMNSVMNLVIH